MGAPAPTLIEHSPGDDAAAENTLGRDPSHGSDVPTTKTTLCHWQLAGNEWIRYGDVYGIYLDKPKPVSAKKNDSRLYDSGKQAESAQPVMPGNQPLCSQKVRDLVDDELLGIAPPV